MTDDKDDFKVIADARLKLEKKTLLLLMPCIAREDTQAVVTSVDASEEESDSEHTGACGKMRRQHMDHIAEKKICGKLSLWLGTRASFHSRSYEGTRCQSCCG